VTDLSTSRIRQQISMRALGELKPAARNARTHSRKQLRQIAASIARFGFTNPVLVDDDDRILAGHGRVAAARELGMTHVPVLCIAGLSAAERRAYALADNKLALNAGWDQDLLALELEELIGLDFDIELTGFSLAEIELTMDAVYDASPTRRDARSDAIPVLDDVAVTRRGEIWELGRHRLLCGDAREPDDYARLMAGEAAGIVFTDPPYNVSIDGNVCGLGQVRHREFAMGSGEMTVSQFTGFLTVSLSNMIHHTRSGAIVYVCMDWRHMRELCEAGEECGLELKNLVVWNKTNGGMGSFYRSKHELIFVFKHGDAPHVNSFGLGETGRYRTNVWDYPGISSASQSRNSELAMHPTVKPAALVADALRDCSRRGDIVLDPFGGSGTTLIAAQQTGRSARLIEFDPIYCDTIIRRFEAFSGKQARLVDSQAAFQDLELERREQPESCDEQG